jgi:hypothetical protein
VEEAICGAGVGNIGLSARDLGFELHRAIATTTASNPKKNTTRSLFMPPYRFDNVQSQMLSAPATIIATPLTHICTWL